MGKEPPFKQGRPQEQRSGQTYQYCYLSYLLHGFIYKWSKPNNARKSIPDRAILIDYHDKACASGPLGDRQIQKHNHVQR